MTKAEANLYAVGRFEWKEPRGWELVELVAGPFVVEADAEHESNKRRGGSHSPEYQVVSTASPLVWTE